MPHRGSPLADNSIGAIALSLIHLPAQVVDTIQSQIGHSLAVIGGKKGFAFPPSVHGLSPKSTLLHALDRRAIQAPHHTIAGDRGKSDTPNSSDGVVLYQSSRTATARGPNSSSLDHTVPSTCRKPSRKSNASSICISGPQVVAPTPLFAKRNKWTNLSAFLPRRACPESNYRA